VEKSDPGKLGIQICNSNKQYIYRLNFMEINYDPCENIPQPDVDFAISMECSEFQKIVQHMVNVRPSNGHCEIKSIADPNMVIFSCASDLTTFESCIEGDPNNDSQKDDIIQGEFILKYIQTMTRCSSMCPRVQLVLQNNYPLIIIYNVGSLGELKFTLAQTL
jgi:proliferating cell nuclear antigen